MTLFRKRRARDLLGLVPCAGADLAFPTTAAPRTGARAETPEPADQSRLAVVAMLFAAAFSVIGFRLVDLSQGAGEPRAGNRIYAHAEAPARRSDIIDRNGELLATSLPTVNLYADPARINDPDAAAEALIGVFPDLDYADLRDRLAADRRFVYLRRHLSPREQFAVINLGIPGIDFEEGDRRVFPRGNLFAHVIGTTDVDGRGTSGLEKAFNGRLADGSGPLRLSVDTRVQVPLRSALAAAMERFEAIGAAGAVMDVHSGELLAMTSLPDFDPNRPFQPTDPSTFNKMTLGTYEMGSTFKLFNTALALETGTATLSDVFDATEPLRMARFTIRDFHPEARPLTVSEILIHSSNIGSAKIALMAGTEAQRAFMRKLGLLGPVGVELPERGHPQVPRPWRDINTATIAFGHGLAVTPLHVLSAVGTLTNGGYSLRPTFVPSTTLPPRQRVVTAETSARIRGLMRLVVEEGSGRNAEVAGYLVGGKTGTAEKLVGGRYIRGKVRTAFAAVFPIDAPRYALLVMLDEPKGIAETHNFATAGWNAAPTAQLVIQSIAPVLGLEPRGLTPETVPVRHVRPEDAEAAAPAIRVAERGG